MLVALTMKSLLFFRLASHKYTGTTATQTYRDFTSFLVVSASVIFVLELTIIVKLASKPPSAFCVFAFRDPAFLCSLHSAV